MEFGLQSVKRRSFHHATGSRRMWSSQMSVHNVTEQTNVPDLPFLRKPSYLYKMCPLVNFERNKSAFKKYQSSLVSYCHSYTQNRANVHCAVFEVIEGLNVSSVDPDAVYFALIQKTEAKDKALLCGLLVCVELAPEFEDRLHEMYTYYPLMVLTGNMKLRKIVQMWFQKEFQGKSSLMSLSPVDLSWVLSLWTGKFQDSEENRPISLAFAVTEEGINQVEIAIEPKDLKKLWDLIHPDSKDEMFTLKQVNDFMGEIEAFIFNAFKLKLGMLKLSKVMTTIASVSSGGIFKLHSQKYIVDVFRLLCNFSTEQLMYMWAFLPQTCSFLVHRALHRAFQRCQPKDLVLAANNVKGETLLMALILAVSSMVSHKIHPDSKDEMFTLKQVNDFMGEIEAFIFNAFKLKLGMLKLSKVMTTIASVSSGGIFKLHSQKYIVDVFRLLCNFSTEQLMYMWAFLPQSNKTLHSAASSD